MRDQFFARQWLQQFKADPVRMGALRQTLAAEVAGPGVDRATDDEVIDRAVQLLSAGAWHVHSHESAAGRGSTKSTGPWKRVQGTAPAQAPSRRSWRLKTSFKDCLVMRAADLIPGDEFLEDPASLRSEIKGWARDLGARRALVEIYTAVSGDRAGLAAHPESSWLAQQVETAFRRRTLVLVREEARSGGGGPAEQEDDSGKPPDTQGRSQSAGAKTWVEFAVVDMEGNPVTNKKFLVTLPDGSLHEGMLDRRGVVRFNYIDPENSVFTLPELDKDAWERVG